MVEAVKQFLYRSDREKYMSKFDEEKIRVLYKKNLYKAKNSLKKLDVFCGNEPDFNGLSGWVFEKTIRHCIEEELNMICIEEQFPLGGRRKADLKVGKFAIEIKANGFYDSMDKVAEKCQKYREACKKKKLDAVLISLHGSSEPLWKAACGLLGHNHVFCLFFKNNQQKGRWKSFIKLLCSQRYIEETQVD